MEMRDADAEKLAEAMGNAGANSADLQSFNRIASLLRRCPTKGDRLVMIAYLTHGICLKCGGRGGCDCGADHQS